MWLALRYGRSVPFSEYAIPFVSEALILTAQKIPINDSTSCTATLTHKNTMMLTHGFFFTSFAHLNVTGYRIVSAPFFLFLSIMTVFIL